MEEHRGGARRPVSAPGGARRLASSGISRLALYYRTLREMEERGESLTSSEALGELTGYSGDQVRRDLTAFGSFGVPGTGYPVKGLRESIGRILGKERTWNVVIIGAGNLGSALLAYSGFRLQGYVVVAAFDADPARIGRRAGGLTVQAMEELAGVVKAKRVDLAVLTVPAAAAQAAAEAAISAGIEGLLNFAPARVTVPDGVSVEAVDLSVQLDRLAFRLTQRQSVEG